MDSFSQSKYTRVIVGALQTNTKPIHSMQDYVTSYICDVKCVDAKFQFPKVCMYEPVFRFINTSHSQ